ncbi:hypothetical protein OK015_17980 [Mycobacterium sp. Aquia_216]|uniref:hypothetical protein n=1 Tax=Mycobacterium sp. Aquia_216 TaxID=2991729 RepID=UPI00227D57EC|nr:hypothetical protein [Mycobacterium sp. Aquia_216]WAJ43109.1 hypothetical protein OK015_17980 [Mycobacterium sp. Aquia_216]
MRQQTYVWAALATTIGMVGAACGSSPSPGIASGTSTTSAKTVTTTVSQATTTSNAPTDLRSLIPTPANTQRTDGPDSIADNGIHLHFLVTGSSNDVLDGYKTALEGASWVVTVESSGGGGGGGGATYTGSNGNSYGVFSGGGYGASTDIDACAWPAKPANPNCGHHQ